MERPNIEHLQHLGSTGTEYPTTYDKTLLERIPLQKINPASSSGMTVELQCPEFTSLCPKTKQPDFANITIKYSPNEYLVESKSLKLYLFSFRNHGEFHEDCIARIAQDIFDLIQPAYITVHGDFYPRGGIKICPTVELFQPYGIAEALTDFPPSDDDQINMVAV